MRRFISVVCLMTLVATSQVYASGRKDPMTAFALSAVVPGGGQFYNEQPNKAVIPIAGAATFLGLWYLAVEDNDIIWDHDGDDGLATIGLLVFLGTQTYGALDAIISANKINRQRGFGHLLEFDGDKTTFGVDAVVSRKTLGTVLTLRF